MPVITFDYNDFINLLGYQITKEQLIEKIPMIGADFDKIEGDELSIEFFPNRPDLTSVEGIARAARAFFNFEPGMKTYSVKPSDITLNVDPSVKTVRPYVTTALIKNVTMTDDLITSLMDLQEKLHFGLGRNRKKVAIGLHNFEPVTPPFTYKAVDPDSVQFIPLQKEDSMTLREILTKHEKGIDYAFVLNGHDKYPLIVDAHDNVLSFPPIINGKLTEVTPYTTEIFIDVTGTDRKYINYALNIVATALAERGCALYSTSVIDEKKTYVSPDIQPSTRKLSIDYVNRILGTSFQHKDIITSLGKMGYNAKKQDSKNIQVDIPAWRSDILHEVDLIEDVSIGYGFDKFQTDFPKDLTFGQALPQHHLLMSLRSIMIGLGFNEVTTFTISNENDEFIKMGTTKGQVVEIENPIGEEYSLLRNQLIPSLLKILRENRHHPLPQQIFELGVVVNEHAKNTWHLAGVKIDAKANFTESKSLTEAILRDVGYAIETHAKNHDAFIKGRCASLQKDKQELGYYGELHPKTIQHFNLEHPIIAFELHVNTLF